MTHILYVEDEPFLAKIVKETLEGNQFKVTHVGNGYEASKTFAQYSFDICILDIMLPGKNGYDIARDIRAKNNSIPIIFLTAKDQTADLVEGFNVGGNDYLRKPFSMEELMVRIKNLLKLTGNNKLDNAHNQSINLGHGYIFNAKRLSLTTPGKVIALSHRESQILEYFCSNRHDQINRQELLIQVWGDDTFYNSRNLDVYITKIRGYFKSHPALKIITLKGVGYQFLLEV